MASSNASSCSPSAQPAHGKPGAPSVALPILPTSKPVPDRVAVSRMGRWRTLSLVAVHVVIIAHIMQWLVMGLTLSPLEPSESMQTLREGVVNAGFVLFAIAILSTLLFGRFFCGWGCHVIAMQDLCAWFMNKCGVRPKPFRSRLMIYMPLALALYMFAWPVIHREVIRPLLMDRFGRLPVWLGQSEPLPSIKTDFFVQDYWATFPSWYVAIPFVIAIGFAIVYFLGSKAFCTFGCPYGGFFAPSDLIAPGKIRVNENCHQCGHCTAVCTSNVRVHEEVRDFGMVVDPGCMKCLDCVSVCPNDALRFGLGTPTLLAKPRNPESESANARRARAKASRQARFDMTVGEDWLISLVFVAMFFAFRGMLNEVPMLMAGAMAAIGAFLVHKLYRCLRDHSVRLQNLQLKIKGRWTNWGRAYALVTVVVTLAAAWSGYVRFHVWRANELYARIQTPWTVTLRPDYAPAAAERVLALDAIHHYLRGSSFRDGPQPTSCPLNPTVTPVGWPLSGEEQSRLAHLLAIVGDLPAASRWLERQVREGEPSDALVFQVAALRERAKPNADEKAAAADRLRFFEESLAAHPYLDQIRAQLAAADIKSGDRQKALDRWTLPLSEKQVRTASLFGAASTHALLGEADKAGALLRRVGENHDPTVDELLMAARMTAALGRADDAKALVSQAAAIKTGRGTSTAAVASAFLELEDAAKAESLAQQAVQITDAAGPNPGRSHAYQQAALVLLQTGGTKEALSLLDKSLDALSYDPWEAQAASLQLAQLGVEASATELLKLAAKGLQLACAGQPDAPTLRHDLAQVYYALADRDQALEQMRLAAELAPEGAFLAGRYAELLSEAGKPEDARKWVDEAKRRSELKPASAP